MQRLKIFHIFLLFSLGIGLAVSTAAERIQIHLLGHAHIDLAYRWRWNETVDRVAPDTFEGVLRMMDQDSGLTYAQSQLALYEAIQNDRPELFARIKEKIRSGRWVVVGGQWSEADAILPGGESMIRQYLIGHEYIQKNLGPLKIDVAWTPDAFSGQALTLPKILKGCGIQYYVFGRGAPADKRIFWWQSRDGSKILAYNIPQHYNIKINEQLKDIVSEWCEKAGFDQTLVLFGEGDHGGGPREADIEAIRELGKRTDLRFLYSTPDQYFAGLARADREWPSHRGELGTAAAPGKEAGAWRGAYVSQARIKKANRDMENLLLTAEKFATLGSMLQRKPLFPRVDFREAWKILLRNQFHDVLPGTSIGDVFDDAMADFLYLKEEGERLLRFGLEVIGSRIDTRGEGIPLVVYNPHSWPRTDVVETAVRFVMEPEQFAIKDDKGRPVLYQVDGWSEDGLTAYISMLASEVPPLGFRVYRIVNEEPEALDSDIRFGPDFVVNKYFKIKWDEHGITSIYDKRLRKELLAYRANTLELWPETASSSWHVALADRKKPLDLTSLGKPSLIEEGPVRVTLLWQDRNESSFFSREMILEAGVPRLKFRLTVDWHDHDKLLKVAFPTTIDSGRAFFEQPYGYIERPANGTLWPAQNWIDLSGRDYGVALLNNGKYGFDVSANTMRIAVVRGARDMDPRMDEGIHSFDYAVYPHKGDWREGNVTQAALELNQPLLAMQENQHAGTLPNWGHSNRGQISLPSRFSFFEIESDHVIISALQVRQGDWSPAHVILRIFETEGRDGQVTVLLPAEARAIVETNHLEEPLENQPAIRKEGRRFSFDIGHDQIRTFRIEF